MTASLSIRKRHLSERRFQAVVIDNHGREVFVSSRPGWNKAARSECQAFITHPLTKGTK